MDISYYLHNLYYLHDSLFKVFFLKLIRNIYINFFVYIKMVNKYYKKKKTKKSFKKKKEAHERY